MNDNLVLFCKTYKGDYDRFSILYKSILKHNIDNIPFYVSVPDNDFELFQNIFNKCILIRDRDVRTVDQKGWRSQQLIKSSFYRLGVSDFYVCVDSDSYFIRDFRYTDFMYKPEVPYMVMHGNKELFELTDYYGQKVLPFDPKKSYFKNYDTIKKFFKRDGKVYHYGPTPCVWRSSVWKYLDKEYGLDLLFSKVFTELKWYGEAVLYMGYPYMPTEPFFKCMHYEFQYNIIKQLNPTEKDLSKNYLGVVMQSNWNAPKKY